MKSAADVWEKVKTLMEKDMTAVSIETWFGDVEAVALEDTRLILCVPTEFKRNIIRTRFLKSVEDGLRELFSFDVAVSLMLPEERDQYRKTGPTQPGDPAFQEYTFDRFVVGSTNKFAFTAAEKVADEPGGAYNPLFIYGQSGLGKTHLLHAIANRVRENHPAYRIMYIKSEDFVNELISNLRHGNDMQGFRDKYRTVDLFLMDDVQFIAGKDSSEEELFHTFNTLYEQKKQIVFTSDRPPQEMLRLEQRLKTRFEQGLPADIQPPDYETRMAILKNKSLERGIVLPDPVLSYVAENITSNVRQIEGVVNKIMAFQELMGAQVDVENTIRAVRDILRAKEDFLPSAETIIQEVARFYELDSDVLRGQSQNKEIATARNVAMYIIREMTQLSLAEIGQQFGGRHHSTVLNSINRVEKMMKDQPELTEIIRDITNAVNSAW
ncbi:chromosomal replication initiator protein DnaA [Pseudoflavonifractor capillosus]|uniref:chromosomal replication initiator protein DnaA n=1 Tax=Pseudoflavonifractor capillosus TaxID=106588 RepID=UPI001958854B|nr:chromosomal replication initiator protein DnaA [Pseudoflavonifractor capillosus]MBM6896916.1 chromosomal replication initiator protein DnaA [Pseudoflavonifractor capillosus]